MTKIAMQLEDRISHTGFNLYVLEGNKSNIYIFSSTYTNGCYKKDLALLDEHRIAGWGSAINASE